ncbi:MAG: efflux RND transporter periplasmic adaptor subunit [Tannerella sp.]|jgi:cobalt-zinc-cadmium efflux system membrane fusion protein|nr:efflux RND transporter periplasmic adaptor subunit [Tannerella sp.]
MTRNIKHLLFLIPAIFIAFSCSNKKDDLSSSPEELHKDFLKDIKTTKAVLSNHEEELTLTGKVEYDPDKIISYVPLISGIVERTYFSFGDKVQKGQALLDIRSADLSALQSELISAEAEVSIAGRELRTAKAMHNDNMLSEKELLEAEYKLKQAEAMYSRVKNDMTAYSPKADGSFAIQSPMTGFIVAKNVSPGTPVSAENEPLFIVADLSEVWVIANVYASNLLFVKEGMDVKITTLSYPGEVFSGKINTLSQVFDPEDKVLKARIKMQNKDLKLKPEMSAVIRLQNETQNKLISIPSDALVFDDNLYFVIVEESPGNFITKEVELCSTHNKNTYIRSGLNEGENVVIKNQLLIYSGLKQK